MSVKTIHSKEYDLFFVTFTCFGWLPLFEITGCYDAVYDWFDALKKRKVETVAYVIMPNHIHCILHLADRKSSLNTLVANGKRFMAYRLINELKKQKQFEVLQKLERGVSEKEKQKGQLHRVFESSFESKPLFTQKVLLQKLNYIHRNPTSKKWQLTVDYADYPHSSAGFYEFGRKPAYPVKHFADI